MFTQRSEPKEAGSKGSQGQVPGLKSQVRPYNKWLHFLLPQPPSKLGHRYGYAGKLPKVKRSVGHCRTEWLRSILEVSAPFFKQISSSSPLWQTISSLLATNHSLCEPVCFSQRRVCHFPLPGENHILNLQVRFKPLRRGETPLRTAACNN